MLILHWTKNLNINIYFQKVFNYVYTDHFFYFSGHEVVAEKDVNPLRLRSTIFYSICAFGLLLSTHGRRTMEHGKQSITLT